MAAVLPSCMRSFRRRCQDLTPPCLVLGWEAKETHDRSSFDRHVVKSQRPGFRIIFRNSRSIVTGHPRSRIGWDRSYPRPYRREYTVMGQEDRDLSSASLVRCL